MTKQIAFLMMLAAVPCLGCSTESASLHTTNEIDAQVRATATGNGTTDVLVSFYDPTKFATFMQMTADDTVRATMGGDTRALSESSLFGAVGYSASFSHEAGDVQVTLARKIDAGAPKSTVTMPAPFTFTPLAKTTYSRAEAIALAWTDPSSEPMGVDVSANCLVSYHQDVDPGATTASIPASALKKQPNSGSTTFPDECDATITLTRVRLGTIDAAFHSGRISGEQTRHAIFHTKP